MGPQAASGFRAACDERARRWQWHGSGPACKPRAFFPVPGVGVIACAWSARGRGVRQRHGRRREL
eukprot:5868653-Lingulodinium_polyedra.AAC.1